MNQVAGDLESLLPRLLLCLSVVLHTRHGGRKEGTLF